jgi:hypothetical protein
MAALDIGSSEDVGWSKYALQRYIRPARSKGRALTQTGLVAAKNIPNANLFLKAERATKVHDFGNGPLLPIGHVRGHGEYGSTSGYHAGFAPGAKLTESGHANRLYASQSRQS